MSLLRGLILQRYEPPRIARRLAYLPWSYCQERRKLLVEYFGETCPVESSASATSRSPIRRTRSPGADASV